MPMVACSDIISPEDAVISDQLNHASIIDGIRLCNVKRYRYANNDMADQSQAQASRCRRCSSDLH